jgi:L-lactate dehydrogenase complex protein LldG
MSQPLTAREAILDRIRTALPGEPQDPAHSHARIARGFDRSGTLDRHACLDLFIDRLVDYDTEIVQIESEAGLSAAIAEALRHAAEDRVVVAPEFPAAWLPSGFEIAADKELTTEALDAAQAVITPCEAAVASTGTIILVHEGAQGRRALTLLPDHHICLVRRDQVFELVPEAMEAIAAKGAQPITTISGPSATSDIEMTRIRGVHGPRRLTVILHGAY